MSDLKNVVDNKTQNMINFKETIPEKKLAQIQEDFYASLNFPFDGMWDEISHNADLIGIYENNFLMGYASLNPENELLNYYISPQFLNQSESIFKQLIQEKNIPSALVHTNNPTYLCASLSCCKKFKIHSLLFGDHRKVIPILPEKGTTFITATKDDLINTVDFCVESMGGPVEWLRFYLAALIGNEELFCLLKDGKIIGTCEVRKSDSQPLYADLGVIVGTAHRRKGWATYLLAKAKSIARERDLQAICSCKADNIGSRKAIEKVEMRAFHRILKVTF